MMRKVDHLSFHNIKGSHNWFYDLIPEPDGLWAATMTAFITWTPKRSPCPLYRQEGLSVDAIDQIGKDAYGDIWILGVDKHVFRLDIARNKLIPFEAPEMPMSDCLTTDTDGDVWFCFRR